MLDMIMQASPGGRGGRGFSQDQTNQTNESSTTAGNARVAAAADERTVRILIEGMTCNHCADAVRRSLLESAGVRGAVVDLKKGEAVVSGSGFDVALLAKAVEALGYRVKGTGEPGRSG